MLLFFSCTTPLICQQKYWQQRVNYDITVKLNDTLNTLDAFEKISYTNNSPDTLTYIWFNVWPNAYKNNNTAFAKQLLVNGSTDFYFSGEEDRGYIDSLYFTVDGKPAVIQLDSAHIDNLKLLLPAPLAPGQTTVITTPFHEKLPYNFSRGGHVGQTYQVTQWYPKPAVFDAHGWHPMPYLDQGEFYSEYGNFSVHITVPDNYIIAASGDLHDAAELNTLRKTGRQQPGKQNNYSIFTQLVAAKKHGNSNWEDYTPPSSLKTKTLHYILSDAHDFAWFASKLFLVQYDSLKQAGSNIDVFTYYHPWQLETWTSSAAFVKDAVRFYTKKVGAYPYDVVSAVAGSDGVASDGMEYPTITLITTAGNDAHSLDATIAHEVGHNWFYGILGTNERDHAWMDEGVNTWYQKQYELEKYGFSDELGIGRRKIIINRLPPDATAVAVAALEGIKKDQPIDTTATAYSAPNYFLVAYEKTSLWMDALRKQLGDEMFDSAMRHYYNAWRFKHPYPKDFKQSIEEASGQHIDALYNKLFVTGPVQDSAPHKTLRFATFFNLRETNRYNYLSLLPAVGLNAYDKLMAGVFIHNFQLPLPRFNFFAAPMYSTGAKTLVGTTRVSFNTFTRRAWWQVAVSTAKFSINEYAFADGSKLYPSVIKTVPSLRLTLYDKDLRSTQKWNFLLRSFIFQEEQLAMVNKLVTKHSLINQLTVSVEDSRVLHPYDAGLTIDQGAKFLRAGFTANYFINYTQHGDGLHARFFAGKFFYLTANSIAAYDATSRYQLNMNGPHGSSDYTYSDYFVGRNTATGVQSQQLMERDGFLKMPMISIIGQSDNWLAAINLTSDIPSAINPFKLFPFKLPVYVFADIGTYNNAGNGRLLSRQVLYDAGLQVSLLSNVVNIYFPLLYSRVYHNYLKATQSNNRFLKTISFNINLAPFKLHRLNSNIPL